jgi:hypothetical protein
MWIQYLIDIIIIIIIIIVLYYCTYTVLCL